MHFSPSSQVQSVHLHAVDGRTKLHVRRFYVSSTFFLMSSQMTLQSEKHLASDHALPYFLMTKESSQSLQCDGQPECGVHCVTRHALRQMKAVQDIQHRICNTWSFRLHRGQQWHS